MALKNKVSFRIGGLPFTVNTDEDPEYVAALAQSIDSRVLDIMRRSGAVSLVQATVLAALDSADRAKKAEGEIASLRSQLKTSLEDSAQAKSERDLLRRELQKYKKGGPYNG